MKSFEPHFGNGIQEWEFYLSYFFPKYFDLNRGAGWGSPPGVYLYLGGAGLVALGWMVFRRNFRAHLPAFAIIAGCSFFLANVYNSAWLLVQANTLLAQVCRGFNSLEGLAYRDGGSRGKHGSHISCQLICMNDYHILAPTFKEFS